MALLLFVNGSVMCKEVLGVTKSVLFRLFRLCYNKH